MLVKKLLAAAAFALVAISPALGQGTQFPAGTAWGNDTASTRPGKVVTATALLDRAFGSTRGSILMRGAAGWQLLTPGAAGLALLSAGAGADPLYGTPNFTNLAGRATLAQLPTMIANSIWINPTNTVGATAQNLAVPACANDGAHALVYVNNTGLQCAVLSTGGTMTRYVNSASNGLTTTGTCDTTTTNFGSACNIEMTAARRTLPTVQRFLSGSGTYTTPANVLYVRLKLMGPGGAGSNLTVDGGVGTATCWNTSGAACTTPVYAAGFGAGGSSPAATGAGGAGGTISGSGTCNVLAIPGGNGGSQNTVAGGPGGGGGHGFMGGGAGDTRNTTAQAGATNTGGGGAGIANAGAGGGSGGGAGAYCETLLLSPAATYTYAVGPGGTAPAGGGNGAAGQIIVEEYYN